MTYTVSGGMLNRTDSLTLPVMYVVGLQTV